jgi:hypothetical protein
VLTFQVVLLGLYKGQKLGQNYEVLVRITPGKVKTTLESPIVKFPKLPVTSKSVNFSKCRELYR